MASVSAESMSVPRVHLRATIGSSSPVALARWKSTAGYVENPGGSLGKSYSELEMLRKSCDKVENPLEMEVRQRTVSLP